MISNLFANLPTDLNKEHFETLISSEAVKVERIVSKGHITPEGEWYDQAQDEWVLVLAGAARLAFDDGREADLKPGDHINIPAHCRHRVVWTQPGAETIWLAVFY